jgi:two-component system response regulator FixJ
MMSGYGEIRDAMRAIRLGAVDFLEKPLSPSVLLDSVQQAAEVQRQRQAHLDRVGDVQARLACLTERERQVMDSVVAGQPNKITAAELGLSRRTVECHRSRVMQKMDAESVPDLIRKVLLCDDADASSQADGSDARSGINRRVG